jgi:ABC-type Fe3+-hydroxamate transport system substrate-binding protein
LLAVVLLLVSCRSRSGERGASARIVEDMQGRKVVLPDEIGRIAGVRPGALRLLAYMDVTFPRRKKVIIR